MNHDINSQLRVSEISKVKNLLVSLKIQIPYTPIPLKYVLWRTRKLEKYSL